MNENEILKFIDPILNFCLKRLSNRQNAEDLAGEIIVHVLSGMKKYDIDSLDSWVWRIARNRYARFIASEKRRRAVFMSDDIDVTEVRDDYDFVDEIVVKEEHNRVFRYLHSLSSEYRNIAVDYYMEQLPVKSIAEKHSLTETTVKWRLNVSREKIRKRMGEKEMEKIYKRINWNTDACNGNMDSDQYLHGQVARAICEVAYEKPLTIEEISLKTGLPTIYIEDEITQLIGGDAIVEVGNKYATNFIVLRNCDNKVMQTKFAPIVGEIADYYAKLFSDNEFAVKAMNFYGSDFTMQRLGYIALPGSIRDRVGDIKRSLNIENGPYPPRLDGGYGWFVVSEISEDGSDLYGTGCNSATNNGNTLNYFHIAKYFHSNIYHNGGTKWMQSRLIVEQSKDGIIPDSILTDDDKIRLLQANLITKDGDQLKLNFPAFTAAQYDAFIALFQQDTAALDSLLSDLILDIHKSFKLFVPARLDSQINQWVSIYTQNIIGLVAEELITRKILATPSPSTPMTNGVFHVGT